MSQFDTQEWAKRKLEKQKKLVARIKQRQEEQSNQHLYKVCTPDEFVDEEGFAKIGRALKNENSIDALRFLREQFEKAMKERANSNPEPKDYELPENEKITSALNNPGFKMVLKHLEIDDPTEGKMNLSISKVFTSKDLQNMTNDLIYFITYNIEFVECKSCHRKFHKLSQHLRQNATCMEKYSDTEIKELYEAKGIMRKCALQRRYQANKAGIAQKYQQKKTEIAKKRKTLKDEIAQKKAQYYIDNKYDVSTKGYKYYAENKDSILKKKAAHYKAKIDARLK